MPDIILFPSPVDPALSVGKRVIALPGETFELRGPLPVPAGSLFVLGDNRDDSEDSTVWKSAAGKPIYFIAIADVTGLVRPWF